MLLDCAAVESQQHQLALVINRTLGFALDPFVLENGKDGVFELVVFVVRRATGRSGGLKLRVETNSLIKFEVFAS